MWIEPILQIRTRLKDITHHSSGGELLVSERFTEQDHAGPTIDRFAGRFLIVAVGKAVAIGKRMSAPNIERAKQWKPLIRAVVIGIALGDQPRDVAVLRGELRLQLAQQTRGVNEVAEVKMMIGKVLRTERDIEADESLAIMFVLSKKNRIDETAV